MIIVYALQGYFYVVHIGLSMVQMSRKGKLSSYEQRAEKVALSSGLEGLFGLMIRTINAITGWF